VNHVPLPRVGTGIWLNQAAARRRGAGVGEGTAGMKARCAGGRRQARLEAYAAIKNEGSARGGQAVARGIFARPPLARSVP
jgi:hypothetical protein